MSASNVSEASLRNLIPFGPGPDQRRHVWSISKSERDFKAALEAEHIPKASALLTKIYEQAEKGDMVAAALFFKVCGLVKKPSDDATVQALAKQLMDNMLAEVERRKHEGR